MNTDSTAKTIVNATLVTPAGIFPGASVKISAGRVTAAGDSRNISPEGTVIDAEGLFVSSGFVDIHLHGGGGHDFMDSTPEAFWGVAEAHAAHGTTCMLPTTLAAERGELMALLDCYLNIKDKPQNGADMPGLHLEGPFFNVAQKGAQDEKYITAPDPDLYKAVLDKCGGVVRIWSSAPELDGACEFARYITSRGVKSHIAHTNAFYDDVVKAVECGYTHVTHLYSGMTGVTRINMTRYAGVVESAYLLDELTVELIADGIHLPACLLKLAHKIKGPRKTALITDAMRAAGTDASESVLGSMKNGLPVIIKNGAARLPDNSALAGSTATTDRLVRNMVKLAGISLPDAICMATATPASIAGLSPAKGALAPGCDADAVIFDEDINIKLTMVKGNIVYNRF